MSIALIIILLLYALISKLSEKKNKFVINLKKLIFKNYSKS